MRFLHLIVGGIAFVVFLSTGGYMQNRFPDIYQGNEVIRMMFRANHVYILLAALLNLGIGCYLVVRAAGWRRRLQWLGSLLILICTGLLVAAFYQEPMRGSFERPLTTGGIFFLFLGTLLHALSSLPPRKVLASTAAKPIQEAQEQEALSAKR
jgi:Na+/melibiose symporter-like transporter